jgi:hypothetical protein
MFFGKKGKSETPKSPIRVTVITDEYIIDAWDDPDLSILQAAYDSEVQEPTGGTIILKDAQVKPLGQVNTPARTFPEWRMPSLVKVIAIVSDDPAAEDLMVNGWLDYEYSFKAVIYAGAFTIEGKILSDYEAPPAFEVHTFVPLEDATITHQLDKKAAPIRGRWGVVNSVLMHGFSAEQ